MGKLKADFQTKLQRLEEEKLKVIQKRKEEILGFIEKVDCLGLDNEILVGALLLAKSLSEQKTNVTDEQKVILRKCQEKAATFFRKKPQAS